VSTTRTWLPRVGRGKLSFAIGLAIMMIAATFGFAPSASAASNAIFTGTVTGVGVTGMAGGKPISTTAGLMHVTIDEASSRAYCIDIHTSISKNQGGGETPWASSGINNLATITSILHTYQQGGDAWTNQLKGTDQEKAAGVQTAIWSYSDGFTLSTPSSGNVWDNYNHVKKNPGSGPVLEPDPSLMIQNLGTPPFYEGAVAGPLVVTSTATSATVVVVGGELVSWATKEPITSVGLNEQFGIRRTGVGTATISASATATVHAGRVFATFKDDGSPKYQRLILANSVQVETDDELTVQWVTPPSTSTTEAETTTSTTPITEPPTTQPPTTEVPVTTTEEVEGIDEESTTTTEEVKGTEENPTTAPEVQKLPRTGVDPTTALSLAGVLLTGGGAMVTYTRRRSR